MTVDQEARRTLASFVVGVIAFALSLIATWVAVAAIALLLMGISGDGPGPEVRVYFPSFAPLPYLAFLVFALGFSAVIFRAVRRKSERSEWGDGWITAASTVLGFLLGMILGGVFFQGEDSFMWALRSVLAYGFAFGLARWTHSSLETQQLRRAELLDPPESSATT